MKENQTNRPGITATIRLNIVQLLSCILDICDPLPKNPTNLPVHSSQFREIGPRQHFVNTTVSD